MVHAKTILLKLPLLYTVLLQTKYTINITTVSYHNMRKAALLKVNTKPMT